MWPFSYYDDTFIINFTDDYGYEFEIEFTIEILNENRLVFSVSLDDYYGGTQNMIYDFHRVTPIDSIGTVLNNNNKKVSLLDYKNYINTINGITA